jgi:hypothetical protein
MGQRLTVKSGVHSAKIDEQAHHGHLKRRRSVILQFLLEDATGFAALGHGIQVYVGKGETLLAIR